MWYVIYSLMLKLYSINSLLDNLGTYNKFEIEHSGLIYTFFRIKIRDHRSLKRLAGRIEPLNYLVGEPHMNAIHGSINIENYYTLYWFYPPLAELT